MSELMFKVKYCCGKDSAANGDVHDCRRLAGWCGYWLWIRDLKSLITHQFHTFIHSLDSVSVRARTRTRAYRQEQECSGMTAAAISRLLNERRSCERSEESVEGMEDERTSWQVMGLRCRRRRVTMGRTA